MLGTALGARTPEGLSHAAPRGPPLGAYGTRREPIDTLGRRRIRPLAVVPEKRVRGGRAKSRPRLSSADPKRAKPRGAAGGRCAKPTPDRKGLSKGSKPRNRGLPVGPSASAAGVPEGKTVCGCFRAVTRRIPFERGKLRRANPMSAAGVKQNRHGLGGSKPSRG
jgi:hypothetical protein